MRKSAEEEAGRTVPTTPFLRHHYGQGVVVSPSPDSYTEVESPVQDGTEHEGKGGENAKNRNQVIAAISAINDSTFSSHYLSFPVVTPSRRSQSEAHKQLYNILQSALKLVDDEGIEICDIATRRANAGGCKSATKEKQNN